MTDSDFAAKLCDYTARIRAAECRGDKEAVTKLLKEKQAFLQENVGMFNGSEGRKSA